MRTKWVAASALLALLAGCGTRAPAAVVTSTTGAATVGCRGWYAVAGRTLYAHLQFLGKVHAASVTAALDDGSALTQSPPVAVASGVSRQTLRVGPLSRGVVGATAAVSDAAGHARGSCQLDNPH